MLTHLTLRSLALVALRPHCCRTRPDSTVKSIWSCLHDGCFTLSKKTIAAIASGSNDYLIVVKRNQKTRNRQIERGGGGGFLRLSNHAVESQTINSSAIQFS